MPTSPKYSFIMPAYKGQFIRESIESILKQTHKDFELIVVDDASPDNLCEIVSEYKDSRIRFYRNEHNIGGADLVAQWNHCLEYARGEWVILATDDDLYESEFLSTADDVLSKHPQVDIFRGRICPCDVDGNIQFVEACMPEYTSLEEFFYLMYNGLFGGIPQYVYRKSALLNIGGFASLPKAYGSDDLTALLLARNGIAASGLHLVKFRYSGINISSENKFAIEKLFARFLLFEHIYTDIIPSLQSTDVYSLYFKNRIVPHFPYIAKRVLLKYFHLIPLSQCHNYIHWIWEHTPYLNKRNKYSLIYRLYFK